MFQRVRGILYAHVHSNDAQITVEKAVLTARPITAYTLELISNHKYKLH